MSQAKRSCDVENMGDFGRYYNSGWVGWHDPKSDSIQPCYVAGIVEPEVIALRPLTKLSGERFSIGGQFPVAWGALKKELDFGLPDIGMFQDGPTVVYTSYATPRSPKKGFRARDMFVSEFNGWDIRKKYVAPRGGERYDWVWNAFIPTYSSLEDAENDLAKGLVVGRPLSRTLGVYSLASFKHSLLAYKRWTVGHVLNPAVVQLKPEYGDYEETIASQLGVKVIVG